MPALIVVQEFIEVKEDLKSDFLKEICKFKEA